MPPAHELMSIVGYACLSLAASYAVLTVVAVFVWRSRKASIGAHLLPPVTMLKPLCGAEPGLYEHLRSFCRQDYPEFQLVCGVRDPDDPACALVKRLPAGIPRLDVDIL